MKTEHESYTRRSTFDRPRREIEKDKNTGQKSELGIEGHSLLHWCYFLSGLSALIYEVAWMGRIQPLVGATLTGLALTLSSFLAGLSFGSYLGSRFATRLRSPLHWYLGIESFIAIWGLCISFFISHFARTGAQTAAVLSLLAVFVPASAMGFTLPLLLAWSKTRAAMPALYGINAGGGAVGLLLAGFVLLPNLGFTPTMFVCALINGAVVILGLGITSNSQQSLLSRIRYTGQNRSVMDADVSEKKVSAYKLLLFTVLAGSLTLGVQLLWNRWAQLGVGPNVYVFPLVGSLLLLGIAGTATSRFSLRFWDWQKILAALAASLLWSFWLLSRNALFIHSIHNLWPERSKAIPFDFLMFAQWIYMLAACMPASILMGALYPRLAQSYAAIRQDGKGSQSVGLAGCLNILGGLCGSLALTFFVLPRVGIVAASLALVAMVGLAFLAVAPRSSRLGFSLSTSLVLIGGVKLLPFDERLYLSGAFYNRHGSLYNQSSGASGASGFSTSTGTLIYQPDTILAQGDDATAVISVHENQFNKKRFFKINGKVDGGSGDDLMTTRLVAELAFLVQSKKTSRDNVLTIGLGTGNTHGRILKFPEVKKATVVELSPVVSQFAKEYFSFVNYEYWNDPRSHEVIGDGRKFLSDTDQKFDLIISEPSNPWVQGQSSLFTENFYQLVSQRLTDQGLASLWFHGYGLGCESVLSILKAIQVHFKRFLVFKVNDDFFVVATNQAEPLKVGDISQRPGFQKNWYQTLGVESLEGFLTEKLWYDEQRVELLTQNVLANNDDNQFLQYDAGRTFYRDLSCSYLEQYRLLDPVSFSTREGAWEKRFGLIF